MFFLLSITFFVGFAQKANNHITKDPRSGFVLIPGSKENGTKYYYIYDHEVSVGDYQEFMNYLKNEQKKDILSKILPDSSKWIFEDKVSSREYFYSKKYMKYPIVCISQEAATEYCKWVESLFKQSKEYLKTAVVRLPTNFEWANSVFFSYKNAIYATGLGDTLINDKQCYLANFRTFSQINTKKKGVLIPLIATNRFNLIDGGMYNMSGNVAEMILSAGKTKGGHRDSEEKDLRIVSVKNFDGPSVYVGFRPIMYFLED